MKVLLENLGLKALHRMDPEIAHTIAITALKTSFVPCPGPTTSSRLQTSLAGIELPNPIGLAAGFDKNATAIRALSRAGFGWIEVGAATPQAQPGNPKPRLFRLSKDKAAINRFGFNNDGMHKICARIAGSTNTVPVGLNLGANKNSMNKASDFAKVLEHCRDHIDFATVNVSSPNTEKLRDLQGAVALKALLTDVMQVRKSVPVFLKIAPDLTDHELEDIAKVAEQTGITAIIATNTTLDRDRLQSSNALEAGGLSGEPLFEKSTRVLAKLNKLTKLPLIGVGGISNAEQAYAKIQAGASALQLYTSLIYGGLSLAAKINNNLDNLLAHDGFANVAQAVGSNTKKWL
ncbi:MAG TPA: dihydroorotate dehydrogenase (quinone) [Rhodobacteraceae bacterium]|nr:quinone-dependent dihydroorotate dehydrogenase [Alphaproteobacteria bacterium]HAB39767.1 dihydroorotate dehydrogenase (quinone) [Paracoccaceae bacterium]